MRQLLVDELSPLERDNIESCLKRQLTPGPLPGLFWLTLPPDLLAAPQLACPQHGPFKLAVELQRASLRLELLVRNSEVLHCSCTAYATAQQRQFALDYLDTLLDSEKIQA